MNSRDVALYAGVRRLLLRARETAETHGDVRMLAQINAQLAHESYAHADVVSAATQNPAIRVAQPEPLSVTDRIRGKQVPHS